MAPSFRQYSVRSLLALLTATFFACWLIKQYFGWRVGSRRMGKSVAEAVSAFNAGVARHSPGAIPPLSEDEVRRALRDAGHPTPDWIHWPQDILLSWHDANLLPAVYVLPDDSTQARDWRRADVVVGSLGSPVGRDQVIIRRAAIPLGRDSE